MVGYNNGRLQQWSVTTMVGYNNGRLQQCPRRRSCCRAFSSQGLVTSEVGHTLHLTLCIIQVNPGLSPPKVVKISS